MGSWDVAVIGAGIAGASAAYQLQSSARTVLLEREPLPGHHTTGRSAAFLVETYGGLVVGRLTRVARPFLEDPPAGFAPHALVEPRPVVWIAREDQRGRLDAARRQGCAAGADVRPLTPDEAVACCPVLRRPLLAAASVEPGALHIDVAGLLEAFLRGFRARGGVVATRCPVRRISGGRGAFEIEAGGETFRAGAVVNAAGAWCDEVAERAGVAPLGLRPLRRTAITFDGPAGEDIRKWPCVIDADEAFYIKPEGAQLLVSPCDETPSDPCDAAPEDYDVALAIDRVERATTLRVRHLRRRWAGLRTFAPDRIPVIGMDPDHPGFFWLAGQGGFGIMTSPAASRAAASLLLEGRLASDLRAAGVREEDLSPARLRG